LIKGKKDMIFGIGYPHLGKNRVCRSQVMNMIVNEKIGMRGKYMIRGK